MKRVAARLVLLLTLAAIPMYVIPMPVVAQQGDERRAYQAGFENGRNDRRQNKRLNLKTGNWKGRNLEAYRRGYRDGYNRSGGDRRERDRDRDRR